MKQQPVRINIAKYYTCFTDENCNYEKYFINFIGALNVPPNSVRNNTLAILDAAIKEENLLFTTEYMRCYRIPIEIEISKELILSPHELLIYTNQNNKPIMISNGGKKYAKEFCRLKDLEVEYKDPSGLDIFCSAWHSHKTNRKYFGNLTY